MPAQRAFSIQIGLRFLARAVGVEHLVEQSDFAPRPRGWKLLDSC